MAFLFGFGDLAPRVRHRNTPSAVSSRHSVDCYAVIMVRSSSSLPIIINCALVSLRWRKDLTTTPATPDPSRIADNRRSVGRRQQQQQLFLPAVEMTSSSGQQAETRASWSDLKPPNDERLMLVHLWPTAAEPRRPQVVIPRSNFPISIRQCRMILTARSAYVQKEGSVRRKRLTTSVLRLVFARRTHTDHVLSRLSPTKIE